jgi:hypothetical protein
MLRRPSDRQLYAVVAVLVAAAGCLLVLGSSSSAPRHADDWYLGTWRVDAPMIGLQDSSPVARPAAAPGSLRVTAGKGGLLISMEGFPGVSQATVPSVRTPLDVRFQTPDIGQGTGWWALVLRGTMAGSLSFYDPAHDHWTTEVTLKKQ